ncbi:translesion error-prone DNA polymerase V autoproteolytic subunit [Pseudanabaena sp. FACHB-1998]|uniref:LexA family protein n=1 Tax=Pseudanabaena sp. FACHB-1998 TaxID=2692858 RepID=UPI001680D6F2|nr:translesion error-prone DNA polymerase V autoproteolytic subunit [Pseudanabaena sp. FACHB-1998]MBD2176246.1 translesion error-prone DNA polymerase V autoproteolytic subunit [Pseudanabaena sp. FACHB-1998]
MPRGGKRTGAGRPQGTGKYGEATKAVRLPIRIADEILAALSNKSDPVETGEVLAALSKKSESIEPIELGTTVQSIFRPERKMRVSLPLYLNPVAAGLPTLTEDYIDDNIDLNRHLVKHPDTTFLVRVVGESMKDVGIHPNDMLIVDRSLEVTNGQVVIAVINGDLTVKRIHRDREKLWLMPENKNFSPIEIDEHTDFHIWGVVTNVIHSL